MTKSTCIADGLTVAGIDGARTFVTGDVVDLDAVVKTHPGGRTETWRDAIGKYLATHFTPAPAAVHESASLPDDAPRHPGRKK